jgi:hypothetical protein
MRPSKSGAAKLAKVRVKQTVAGVTVATALSSVFQQNYFKAVGAAMNPPLPPTAFTVNSVTAPSRRALLGTTNGALMDYTAQSSNTDPLALQGAITNPAAQQAVNQQMNAAGFKGLSVSAPAVTNQTPTSSPTAPPVLITTIGTQNTVNAAASPGAIAGYVIGGVIVIVGVVFAIMFGEIHAVAAQRRKAEDSGAPPIQPSFYPAMPPPPSTFYPSTPPPPSLRLQELGTLGSRGGSPSAAAANMQGRSGIQFY